MGEGTMKQWVSAVHVWEDRENEEEDCANTVRVARPSPTASIEWKCSTKGME